MIHENVHKNVKSNNMPKELDEKAKKTIKDYYQKQGTSYSEEQLERLQKARDKWQDPNNRADKQSKFY